MTYFELLIEEILSFLKREQEIYTRLLDSSPEGSLSIDRSRKPARWVHRISLGKDASGRNHYGRTTIPRGSDMIAKLADKEYARISLKILDYDLRILTRAFNRIHPYTQEAVLSGMHSAYQKLPRKSFRKIRQAQDSLQRQREWAEEPYEISDYKPEEKTQTTSWGLKVRTRAELLIAEALYKHGVPFRYEQVIQIGKYRMAPDFTFLDRDGNEFYWDYCGMMAVPSYRDHQLWRRRTYENVGICEWENMIYTYDASDSVDMREIEAIIKTRILPRMLPAAQA